jgi:predicted transcriptional regulator
MILRFATTLEVSTDDLLQPAGPKPLRRPSRRVLRRLDRIESLPPGLTECAQVLHFGYYLIIFSTMETMRTTTGISITLPPEMLKRAKKLAGKENRTMSELIREAFREYEQKRRWDEINAFGRAKAAELGIINEDVPRLVKEVRAELRKKNNQPAR